jgi:membrane protein YdbS with pleckstrin-like domain
MPQPNKTNGGISYDFRGRRANENVAMVVSYHAWLLMPIVYAWLVLVAIISGLMLFFGASQVTSYAIVIAIIVGVTLSFYRWFLWNNSKYIVTNQRIIRLNQLGMFNREISEAEIDRIQEISTDIKGPIHTLLNFGTIRIKTASDESRVDLVNVVDPYDIQQEVARIRQEITGGDLKVKNESGLD